MSVNVLARGVYIEFEYLPDMEIGERHTQNFLQL